MAGGDAVYRATCTVNEIFFPTVEKVAYLVLRSTPGQMAVWITFCILTLLNGSGRSHTKVWFLSTRKTTEKNKCAGSLGFFLKQRMPVHSAVTLRSRLVNSGDAFWEVV